MELEGSRFLKKLPSHSKSFSLYYEVLKYLSADDAILEKKFQTLFDRNNSNTLTSSMESIEDDYPHHHLLSKDHSNLCLLTHRFVSSNLELNHRDNSHVITTKRISNSREFTKVALDEDTFLTGRRSKKKQFRFAYNPEMISTMVLESLDGLFGDPFRSSRHSGWSKTIKSMFKSIWKSKDQSEQTEQSLEETMLDPTDWVLLQLYYSVCGDSQESCTIKWFTTLISDVNEIHESPNSRLVLIALCFDNSGMFVRISGITSSKASFHVFGY